MTVKLKLFILCLLPMILGVFSGYAENTSLEAIFASPEIFSGAEVQIEGEVIGEPLNDDKGVWFNLSTGSKQIGIFVSDKEIIEVITYWGSYKDTGDQVRVRGTFYKECPDHQISDLHLASLDIIRKGHSNKYFISDKKQLLAKILSIICLTIAVIYLIKLKYGKRD